MKESITRRRQAPSIATIGSTCDLNLKIPGVSRGEPGQGRAGRSSGPSLPSEVSVLLANLSLPSPWLCPQETGSRWCLPRSA